VDTQLHPSDNQRLFFEQHILGEEATIFTLKVRRESERGFAVNVRGPFVLAEYPFDEPETVIDASWAGDPGSPESRCHLHCCWAEVRFAKQTETNPAVRRHIGYQWQLAFFATREDAEGKPDRRLFWFYLRDDEHKAVRNLRGRLGAVLPIA
jgi:hypothetical protein